MSDVVTFTTRTDAQRYERLCARAAGLPSKGRHIGAGRHAAMTDDPTSPGWTTAWDEPRKHPAREEYAVAAIEPARTSRLTTQEQTELETKYAERTQLDSTWYPETTATRER